MRYRPLFPNSPRLAASFAAVMAFVTFLAILRITHLSLHWVGPAATGGLFTGFFIYIARTRTPRFLAYAFATICAFVLIFYAYITVSLGVPSTVSDRLSWAFVVAIPTAGLGMAWWILHRTPAKRRAQQDS